MLEFGRKYVGIFVSKENGIFINHGSGVAYQIDVVTFCQLMKCVLYIADGVTSVY